MTSPSAVDRPDPISIPRILAIGGSSTPMAASERALRFAGAAAERHGAIVTYLTSRDLMIPIYDTETSERSSEARRLVTALREADGILLASPGYHGAVSGLVKNALDYAEDLRDDPRPYLDGRAVGCISLAHGWQTAVGTLNQLRQIVHALRGWPTPLGAAINDSAGAIRSDEAGSDPAAVRQLHVIGAQVADFAHAQRSLHAQGRHRAGG